MAVVMALVPHPDDAEYHAGGLLANFAARGDKIIIVTITDGRCGSYEHNGDELARLRAEEARRGARVLGAEEPILLGYHDFEADLIPPGELREKFIRLIRMHRPEITVCEDSQGLMEFHPDHRAVAVAACEAVEYASLPLVYPEHLSEGLQPHFVTEKYFWAEEHLHANKVVDITASMDRKMAALAEHTSQVRFLVDGTLQQGIQAGIKLEAALGPLANDHLAALTWAIQSQAAEAGSGTGYQYAETYRYERYHPLIENFLAQAGQ